ncbi:hypothetical protein ACFPK9_02715 [Rubritalea spongiae]|uniref:DUF3592 domain-containing protein n=1 Tax=Rubritalea spongiae TaxID=430797 RepID=A0ABW5E1K5_9BACT
MSENPVIVCKPTQWIKIRAILILLMFGVFAYLFYHDGTVGYREKNEHFVFHKLFTSIAPQEADKFEGAAEWNEFASTAKIPTLPEEECPLPADFDREQTWPAVLASAESFEKLKNTSDGASSIWRAYTGEKGWDFEPSEKIYDQGKLNEQFYMAGICGVLVLVVLFLFLRTLSRKMMVTETAYIAPGGKKVPYSAMRRIDARKWDVKGMAVIEYEDESGAMKKVKVDGMIYGQFKEKDGQPAERLYEYIMERFKGEVIEFEKADEESSEEDKMPVLGEEKNSKEATNS